MREARDVIKIIFNVSVFLFFTQSSVQDDVPTMGIVEYEYYFLPSCILLGYDMASLGCKNGRMIGDLVTLL